MGNGGRTAGSWSHLPSGSRELVFRARVLWTLAHGTAVPTFRLGLSIAVISFWKRPHRHAQRCVSVVISGPVKLTMKRNHPSVLYHDCLSPTEPEIPL